MGIALEVIKTVFAMYGFLRFVHNSNIANLPPLQKKIKEGVVEDMTESICSNCSSIMSQSSVCSETKSTQTNMIKSLDPNNTKSNINRTLAYYDGPYITPTAYHAVGVLLQNKCN